ncbi:MAG: (d)CMP kinase [Desulfatiglandales bacterium]
MIVTVDGPAGSGKSTVSRLLAKRLGVLYLDTGAMYRAVALYVKRRKIDIRDEVSLKALCMDLDLKFSEDGTGSRLYSGKEDISSAIRTPEMDMLSSRVSAVGQVREAMTELQRKIGREGSLVAEGRDMGSVVFPDADHKFFLTASPGVRAMRRFKEREDRGEDVSPGEVEEELRKRDAQDSARAIAPLRPAEDAMIIDTSEMEVREVVDLALNIIHKG